MDVFEPEGIPLATIEVDGSLGFDGRSASVRSVDDETIVDPEAGRGVSVDVEGVCFGEAGLYRTGPADGESCGTYSRIRARNIVPGEIDNRVHSHECGSRKIRI